MKEQGASVALLAITSWSWMKEKSEQNCFQVFWWVENRPCNLEVFHPKRELSSLGTLTFLFFAFLISCFSLHFRTSWCCAPEGHIEVSRFWGNLWENKGTEGQIFNSSERRAEKCDEEFINHCGQQQLPSKCGFYASRTARKSKVTSRTKLKRQSLHSVVQYWLLLITWNEAQPAIGNFAQFWDIYSAVDFSPVAWLLFRKLLLFHVLPVLTLKVCSGLVEAAALAV